MEFRKQRAYDIVREPMIYNEEELNILNTMHNPQEAKELALHLIWCIENPLQASQDGGVDWFREVAYQIADQLRVNNHGEEGL